ncbi:fasciclin domain-containing protein [Hymenobacter busanensis]|uniref:Fasciclin domain-containing protein n=1 Tax=Hymenobacter busanensis TaxID=2607656 RepID=A0A7L4ZU02_9BACT|nr:fasciclin domain-containing protein [Hymenobacter busanensis]KAA9339626.1 fasciclin domain-containing protein [Hymenobacter busanensis]QHJ06618.1 fasciclin domain-containing protein [Hymenobacter busanensis]
MKKVFTTASLALLAAATLGLSSCGDNKTTETTSTTETSTATESAPVADSAAASSATGGVMVGGAMMTPDKDIVANALGSADHTTLVAAVKAAGLVETLQGKGPFTVFAPTNAAFNALPAGTVDGLLKPENKAKLTGVLTYHVVPGALRAADLKDGQELTTVQGEKLKVGMADGKTTINGATVEIADVISSNGVTHVINQVLLPKM